VQGQQSRSSLSYALAIREQVPLLFKGVDFTKTDARVAEYTIATPDQPTCRDCTATRPGRVCLVDTVHYGA